MQPSTTPDLIVACVVGDGEAETGPLATSWHSNKFLNPVSDGAVLPILHLNGYKIAGPTVLSRISREELEHLFRGYGHTPYFVEGDDPAVMHRLMAEAMDQACDQIRDIQSTTRSQGFTERPRWPMIILRSPKGWTGPEQVDGQPVVGTCRSHQVPLANLELPEHLKILEDWLLSYRPEELFDSSGRLVTELQELVPAGTPQPYWVNTSDNALVYESLAAREDDIREQLQGILEGREVRVALNDNTVFADIARDPDSLWSFLVHTGYLKVGSSKKNSAGDIVHSLFLPNEELRSIFRSFIQRAYWKPSYKGLVTILDAILEDDAAKLQKELGELFLQIVSFHDVAKEPEAFIHGFFLAMAANLSNRYSIESNRESGLGRADMILIPKHPTQFGVPKIFEFKAIAKDDDPQAALADALKQIADKNYAARCRAAGFVEFAAFALVQQGKQLFIRRA